MTHQTTVDAVRVCLIDVFRQVDRWFDRPADERAFHPASGGWTIDEVLEHISLTNHFLMLTLRKAVERAVERAAAGQPIPGTESDLDRLQPIGERGTFRWEHPEHMEPRGGAIPQEVRARIGRQAGECLKLLDRIGRGEGALGHLHMSVDSLGRIDLYQWLHFLTQHAQRHLQQMAAIEGEFSSR